MHWKGKPFLTKLLSEELKGAKISSKVFINESSDSFTMTGVTLTAPNAEPISMQALVVRGLKEVGDNRIELDTMTIVDFALNSKREGKGHHSRHHVE